VTQADEALGYPPRQVRAKGGSYNGKKMEEKVKNTSLFGEVSRRVGGSVLSGHLSMRGRCSKGR